jgi:hypothetical protein
MAGVVAGQYQGGFLSENETGTVVGSSSCYKPAEGWLVAKPMTWKIHNAFLLPYLTDDSQAVTYVVEKKYLAGEYYWPEWDSPKMS